MTKKKKITILIVLILLVVVSAVTGMKYLKKQKVESFSEIEHSYDVYRLDITSGSNNLYGMAYVPNDVDGKVPTVILSHGFGINSDYWERTAKSLAMSGYASYAFDFSGGGKKSRSDGDMTNMSIFTEQSDLKAVIEEIKKQDFVDLDNLFLMGESQGGIVTAITAPAYKDEVKGVVLYYPAFLIPENAQKKFNSIDDVPETVESLGHTIGRTYYEGLFDYDPYEVIGGYTGPVLMIHGDHDELVPLSYSERALQVYENAELVTLEGEIHGWTVDGKGVAAKRAFQFFEGLVEK
jgi:uncharacterized protein